MNRPTHNPARFRRDCRRRGFTLIEVLATIVLLGIVLPVAVAARRGAGSGVARETPVTGLNSCRNQAQRTDQTISSGQVSTGPSAGDFPDSPDYRWTSQSVYRDYGLTQVTVQVTWNER